MLRARCAGEPHEPDDKWRQRDEERQGQSEGRVDIIRIRKNTLGYVGALRVCCANLSGECRRFALFGEKLGGKALRLGDAFDLDRDCIY
jgi:hypothetical protein